MAFFKFMGIGFLIVSLFLFYNRVIEPAILFFFCFYVIFIKNNGHKIINFLRKIRVQLQSKD